MAFKLNVKKNISLDDPVIFDGSLLFIPKEV